MFVVNQARIHIYGPDARGRYMVEFRKHTGERLTFVVPPNADNSMLAYFQDRMPYGLAVLDVDMIAAPETGGMSRRQ
jgi:hypothetical protein